MQEASLSLPDQGDAASVAAGLRFACPLLSLWQTISDGWALPQAHHKTSAFFLAHAQPDAILVLQDKSRVDLKIDW
jgi:hypothetical protein